MENAKSQTMTPHHKYQPASTRRPKHTHTHWKNKKVIQVAALNAMPSLSPSQRPHLPSLHTLRRIHLHVINLRIVPPGGGIIDVEMALHLIAIGTVVRDEEFDLRGTALLFVAAGDTVPRLKKKEEM